MTDDIRPRWGEAVSGDGFLRGLIRSMVAARGDCSVGSLMNCHARGLHSIVLRERPMVRLFVTTPDHELWRTGERSIPAAIAFHSHHCDLRLETVMGKFYNWTLSGAVVLMLSVRFSRFVWDSQINGGSGRFTRAPGTADGWLVADSVPAGHAVTMAASDIHTVEVTQGMRAAWLVTEGQEDPAYQPVSYSQDDLTQFDPTGLYVPMTRAEADGLLATVLEPR